MRTSLLPRRGATAGVLGVVVALLAACSGGIDDNGERPDPGAVTPAKDDDLGEHVLGQPSR
ncbi:hypothetical protein [Salana multivorans]